VADLEFIRQRCRELPIPELFREVLVNAGDYVPAAQQAMREELERRVGDIRTHVERERRSTGDQVLRLEGVRNFGRTRDRFGSALVFTTGGFGFVATERARDELDVRDGVVGMLYTLIEHELEKRAPDLAAASQAPIPLSLLAAFHDGAFWWPARSECSIEIQDDVFRVCMPGDADTWGRFDEHHTEAVGAWGAKVGVPVTRLVREPFSKTIRRWFGKKDA
jgi:hypothetical protein